VEPQNPDREGGQLSLAAASSLTVAAQIAEAPAAYQPIPLAYFITYHTYGTWLPGDENGSVDHAHNVFGTPMLPPDPGREAQTHTRMDQPAYTLDAARRALVLQAIQEVCVYRGWSLFAVHVRTNHVHVVVYANQAPERVMTDFKAYASRKLSAGGFDVPERKRWTRHGSTRYLWHANHIEAAIRYVVHEQGEAMAVYENTERIVSQPPVATGGAVKETVGKYVALVPIDELPMLQIEDVEPPNPNEPRPEGAKPGVVSR
jgi:REP element-mobilizing transposase RayT